MGHCLFFKMLFVMFAFTIWLGIIITILVCLITIARNTCRIAGAQKQIAEAIKELAARKLQ